jgi:predicted transcriptional regulator of viral defense system
VRVATLIPVHVLASRLRDQRCIHLLRGVIAPRLAFRTAGGLRDAEVCGRGARVRKPAGDLRDLLSASNGARVRDSPRLGIRHSSCKNKRQTLYYVNIMAFSKDATPSNLSAFVEDTQAAGRYTFSGTEARVALGVSETALDSAVRRLRARGRLVAPRRGFFVIVPTEYRTAGAPPPSWFIDDLMQFLGQPYYVGLLSAAALHGASHQQSMVFQVVTDRPTRSAEAGRARIEFRASGMAEDSPVTSMQTETGSMRVSTPETTAFDLVKFSSVCGGWSNVATVLSELAERIDPASLHSLAETRKSPEVQRLGFLLDRAGGPRLADALLRSLAARRYRPVPLARDMPSGDAMAAQPWRVIPNVEVELDL